jgi:hypothetical protein
MAGHRGAGGEACIGSLVLPCLCGDKPDAGVCVISFIYEGFLISFLPFPSFYFWAIQPKSKQPQVATEYLKNGAFFRN